MCEIENVLFQKIGHVRRTIKIINPKRQTSRTFVGGPSRAEILIIVFWAINHKKQISTTKKQELLRTLELLQASDGIGIWTHNHLIRKWTLKHLSKLV